MNRQFLSAVILIFYLIPFIFLSAYSMKLMSPHKSWALLSLGLLLVVCGTLALMFLLYYWEKAIKNQKPAVAVSRALLSPLKEKEAKVTSLDSSLTFILPTQHELLDLMGSKENTKELSLLQTALKSNQEQQEELTKLLASKSQELQKQEEENKQLQFKVQQVAQDFADYKLFSDEQLKQKQLQLTTLQQLIEDQRAEVEKRQEQIHQLDTKVHDLSYEIKTLLYLHEEEAAPFKSSTTIKEEESRSHLNQTQTHDQEQASAVLEASSTEGYTSEYPIRTQLEAANLLKKCVNIAQKLTGSNYYSNESTRYREFSSSYYAIDQRRLFDSLRSETGALIIVYSQKEQKLLFANHETRTILGWNPEKLLADFSSIMQEGMNEWKKALNLLSTASDTQIRLLAKSKQGQEILLHCHLKVVPTGLFRHFAIGVLYPA